MTDPIMAALPGERVIQSSPLATVTTHCVIVRNPDNRSRTIVPLRYLAKIKTSKTTYPGLLVIAAALFVLAAAAYYSKQDVTAAIPMAILGSLFLLAYMAYRKASIAFVSGGGSTSTTEGNLAEVALVVGAVTAAQADNDETAVD